MSDWYVGQKVVCVDDGLHEWSQHPEAQGCVVPLKGSVYTIRDIRIVVSSCQGEIIALWVEEIRNPEMRFYDVHQQLEPGWHAEYFRPLVDVETDISIFKKIDADVFGKVAAE